MDSTIIKKQAICKQLGELFHDTCQYDPSILCRWDDPIEPDIQALKEFRFKLTELAELHFENKLTAKDVKMLDNW